MKNTPLLLILSTLTLLQGCTTAPTKIEIQPIKHSESKGLLTYQHTYGLLEPRNGDMRTMIKAALLKCKDWGYLSAQAHRMTEVKCNVKQVDPAGQSYCVGWRAHLTFRCIVRSKD